MIDMRIKCMKARFRWMTFVALASGVFQDLPVVAVELPDADIRRDASVIAVEQVMPSVVNIATKSVVPVRGPFDQFYPPEFRPQRYGTYYSLGSGVIIDEAGYLLTNEHVVRGAKQIAVRFVTGTNDYEAVLVDKDDKMDVALLKLKAAAGEKFHAIRLAREDDLLLGETVLALGNPFGLGGSVTRGILSSKSRRVPKEGEQLDIPNWLQTDAPINKGNSGGPLVNLRGELIGINVAVINEVNGEPAQGLGFAIPIRLVEEALSDIFPTEFVKSYWFGARVKVGTSPLAITTVQPDSPAGRAGLKPGDVVLQVNGRDPKSFIDFADLLSAAPGSEVTLTLQRGNQEIKLPLKLVPENSVFNAALVQERLGVSMEPKTVQLPTQQLKAYLITNVQKGGPAESAGLESGMLMLAIDGQAPANVVGLAKLVHGKKRGERVALSLLTLRRDGDYSISLQEWSAQVTLR